MKPLPWVMGLVGLSAAIHLPMQRLAPRAGSTSTAMKKQSGAVGLGNTQNIMYTAEVKVGDTSYTLQLDTGSSDLWFAPGQNYNKTFANAKIYEELQLNLTYGTGWTFGSVAQTDVEFAGFAIKNQSFIFVKQLSQWDIDFGQQYPTYQGIAGLSFDINSQVNLVVLNSTNSTWGRSLMSNIFLSDPSTPNHIAFLLDRTGDLNDTDTGSLDIGTYAAGYEAVETMPKHAVFTSSSRVVQQWNVVVDGISINGKEQALKSSITVDESAGVTNAPPKGSISALMDTGTSGAEIPEAAFHELYKSMGGVLINGTTTYAVPCMAEALLEVIIGNLTVVVHSLDLTTAAPMDFGTGQNLTVCSSSYDPAQYGGGDNDIILGDAFLRNVYAVYNYGDFVSSESGLSTGSPFIQILPLTDAKKASSEFKKARAEALAALPPQVDVSTINDPTPKPWGKSGNGSNSSTTNTPAAKLGAGSVNADLTVASTSGDDSMVASLKTLATLAPIALGLLGLSVALLVVLIVLAGIAFLRLRKQGPTAYVPVPLERERVGEYKDEQVTYDTKFRD